VEQFQVRGTAKKRAGGHRHQAITGVTPRQSRDSGRARALPTANVCRRHHISDRLPGGLGAVIQEFFERGSPGGLRFSTTTAERARHVPYAHAECAADGTEP